MSKQVPGLLGVILICHAAAMRMNIDQLVTDMERVANENENDFSLASYRARRDIGFAAKIKDSAELAMEAVERACVDDLGEDYEEILKERMPELLPGHDVCGEDGQGTTKNESNLLTCDSLRGLLDRRWGTEDEYVRDKKNMFKKRLNSIKSLIRGRLFSVQNAKKLCKSLLTRPRQSAVKECMLQHIENRNYAEKGTFKNVNFGEWLKGITVGNKWNHTDQSKVGDDVIQNLKKWTEERLKQSRHIELLGGVVDKHSSGSKQAAVYGIKAMKEDRIQTLRGYMKPTGFSYWGTKGACEKQVGEDTLGNSAEMLARIADEVKNRVSTKVNETGEKGGECAEKLDTYCPEGLTADARRGFDPMTYTKVYVGTFAVYKPMAMLVGGAVGFMVGGPPTAAAFAAAAAIPGPGFVVPIPIATAAATDWFPKCRCYPNDCEFDYDLGYCLMPGGTSRNPFERLPYTGHKCAPSGIRKPDKSKPGGYARSCKLIPCNQQDFKKTLMSNADLQKKKPQLSGFVGLRGSEEVQNCLATHTEGSDTPVSLLTATKLPPVEDEKWIDNTPENRVALYEELGVSFKPAHGYGDDKA